MHMLSLKYFVNGQHSARHTSRHQKRTRHLTRALNPPPPVSSMQSCRLHLPHVRLGRLDLWLVPPCPSASAWVPCAAALAAAAPAPEPGHRRAWLVQAYSSLPAGWGAASWPFQRRLVQHSRLRPACPVCLLLYLSFLPYEPGCNTAALHNKVLHATNVDSIIWAGLLWRNAGNNNGKA